MIHHCDCLEFMRGIVKRGERVNAIITDPPYLYLNHKLDRQFNEREFFELASKITDKIVFFGRGDSFYKWNLLCADFGFEFKEEVVWDKGMPSSCVQKLGRRHETISIRAKNGASINKVTIDSMRKHIREDRVDIIIDDLKKILSDLKNGDVLKRWIEKGEFVMRLHKKKHKIASTLKEEKQRVLKSYEKCINGALLQSVIYENREHRVMHHPTQKPINLLRKLVLLISDKGDLIFDPFMGSGSTGIASLIEGRKFVGCEIDSEYFEIAKRRIDETDKTLRQSLFYGID